MDFAFEDVARLPVPDDNVAIAIKVIEPGTKVSYGDATLTISHTVLVGHRFAIQDIAIGEPLFSWAQTFGIATKPIKAGEYVVNTDVLKELGRRSLDMSLPDEANFQNDLEHYQFDEAAFTPATPLPRYDEVKTFMGYPREGERGVGTRNNIILLGTTSLVSGFVRKLETRLKDKVADYPNIDGIVAVAHTEGGHGKSNNEDLLLRTLAGFIVHPNVGAVLIVDYGYEAINNELLKNYLKDYPLDAVLHDFMSLSASFEDDLTQGETIVANWLDKVNSMERSPQPLSELKIALQCGGSDAFSGVSGNPLAAWVAKEVIQYGGAANLAETDELIGAETYVLDKIHSAETAKKFISFVERFKERVGWHGHSADGNPSGGNKFRGLYNIYLKSLGAATKRHPDVPLDFVIDYSERMIEGGYYFMDSPGNDLESIAGQVASGCNMIFFVTGNGSITNFPFVPTIKIVTTTDRFNLLESDMDINAGKYLDGMPLPKVGAETFDYTLDVASGQLSVGEKAGHSQVQIWRDWQLTHTVELEPLRNVTYSGKPIPINQDIDVPDVSISMLKNADVITGDQVGLILPTSLCSGQIAKMCVEALNKHPMLEKSSISRFVTLTHTEGCGGSVNPEFRDTLVGYLGHSFVKHALLLEHGCEATHNDFFRLAMMDKGFNPSDYGWASIQLDGGIQAVIQKMVAWFENEIDGENKSQESIAGLESARIVIVSDGRLSAKTAKTVASITQMVVKSGGLVLIGEEEQLLSQSDFVAQLRLDKGAYVTLGYAEHATKNGFHIMAMPTRDRGEILSGLGTTVDLILSVTDMPLPGHPMIPVLHVSDNPDSPADIILGDKPTQELLNIVADTLSRRYAPKVVRTGNVNFQVTRGLLGVSL